MAALKQKPLDEIPHRNLGSRRNFADHGASWMLLRAGVLNT
jgi:hypothetical protein